MQLRKVFSVNLRHFRGIRGLSQEELADRAHIDRTYVSALERGLYAVSIDVLERLAMALDIAPSELLRDVGHG